MSVRSKLVAAVTSVSLVPNTLALIPTAIKESVKEFKEDVVIERNTRKNAVRNLDEATA